MIINSNKNLDYYPNNVPYKFKTHFAKPLDLNGRWTVAITEIDIIEKLQNPYLYISCDLCQNTIVDGTLTNVLRKVNTDARRQFSNSFNYRSFCFCCLY